MPRKMFTLTLSGLGRATLFKVSYQWMNHHPITLFWHERG